jgi:transposase
VVVVDRAGRQLDQTTVAARTLGHGQLVGWARTRWPERLWAVEDCRHVSGRRERDLLAAGERVVRVPPRLMAGARQPGRTAGTSDPIDALAVARAAVREPDLPSAGHDQASWEVKLLVDHREQLVAERTRTINRLRWQLHQLDPDLEQATRRRPGPGSAAWPPGWPKPPTPPRWCRSGSARPRSPPSARSATRSANWTGSWASGSPGWPPRCSACPAAGPDRGQAARRDRWGGPVPLRGLLASHAGVAPVPVSSGRTDRHRRSRGGNRQLNAALHRIVITQLRSPAPASATISGAAPRARDQGGRPGPQTPHRPRRLPATPSGSATSRHRPHDSPMTEEQPGTAVERVVHNLAGGACLLVGG